MGSVFFDLSHKVDPDAYTGTVYNDNACDTDQYIHNNCRIKYYEHNDYDTGKYCYGRQGKRYGPVSVCILFDIKTMDHIYYAVDTDQSANHIRRIGGQQIRLKEYDCTEDD